MSTGVLVNVDNYVRAETARMFDGVAAIAGGINRWVHYRQPTPLDGQTVIRMNRDTLYSGAIVDISGGARVTLPEADDRYMSLMVINEDHYVSQTFHQPGTHELVVEEIGTPYVSLTLRILVDPEDHDDIAAVNALQDAVTLEAASATPYAHPNYDEESLKATYDALVALSSGVPDTTGMFGRMEDVGPVRHLIGTAIGWGGLPEAEAYYYLESEPRVTGRFTFRLSDVPVNAFWSVTIYNRDGFLEKNPYDSYSINSLTAVHDEDGAVTLNLAPEPDGVTNHLYIMDGWNYALRLYRPRPEVIEGDWVPSEPQLVR